MPVIDGQGAKPPVIGPIIPARWRPHTTPAALGTVALIALKGCTWPTPAAGGANAGFPSTNCWPA